MNELVLDITDKGGWGRSYVSDYKDEFLKKQEKTFRPKVYQ